MLTVNGDVNQGEPNTIKLAIADALDDILDSWVFIAADTFTGDPDPSPIPLHNWALYLAALLMLAFVMIRLKRLF